LGSFVRNGFAGLVVAVLRPAHAAHHLLGRDAIHPLGVDADKVLPADGRHKSREAHIVRAATSVDEGGVPGEAGKNGRPVGAPASRFMLASRG